MPREDIVIGVVRQNFDGGRMGVAHQHDLLRREQCGQRFHDCGAVCIEENDDVEVFGALEFKGVFEGGEGELFRVRFDRCVRNAEVGLAELVVKCAEIAALEATLLGRQREEFGVLGSELLDLRARPEVPETLAEFAAYLVCILQVNQHRA